MEKFIGVNNNMLLMLRFQFEAFVEDNFDLFEATMGDHLRLFNDYFTGVPESFVGSKVYMRRKEGFYNGIFDTYCRVRLAAYLNGNLIDKYASQTRVDVMKAGRVASRLITRPTVNHYRDERAEMFAKAAYKNLIGESRSDETLCKEELIRLSIYLSNIAPMVDVEQLDKEALNKILRQKMRRNLKILEENMKNRFGSNTQRI